MHDVMYFVRMRKAVLTTGRSSPIASVQKRRNLIAMTQSRMPHHGACVVFETRCVGKTTAEELRKEHRSG